MYRAEHKFQGFMKFMPLEEGLRPQYLFPWDLGAVQEWPDFPESLDSEEEDPPPGGGNTGAGGS